ncbi:MAG: sulfite exporter TauE/SafE family protein, partial [Thermoplasmata archaeon]|nr:sulfite exporter TauE/SafE family protein [Thermoplasmata archaeon]
MDASAIWLAILALGAAIINGAVGYGFSSIVTPIAVLWYSNKVLNPALVLVELVVNVTLLFRERKFVPGTFHRASPVISTLFPGVVLGTVGLTYLAVNDVKFALYVLLAPLVTLQLLGVAWPIRNEKRGGR